MEIVQIKQVLPHRYPMLLVDRVDDLVPGQSLRACKAISANEPWYRDLPDTAKLCDHAYPSVLLLESWCQAAGVLAAHDRSSRDDDVMLFGSVANAHFHGQVLPGDLLEHEVHLVRALSDVMIFEGQARVGSELVLEIGRAVMAIRPAEQLVEPVMIAAGAGDSHE